MILTPFISKINSWNDFKTVLESKTKLEKGKAFEELTKYYLQYERNKAKLKNVWLLNEVPHSIAKKLNLPKSDQGIDLIGETPDGSFWAIQCKYLQDEDHRLSHRAISTFISLSKGIAKDITYCLVCTTVDEYAKIYKGKENIGFVNSDEWRKLDKEFFDFVRAKLKGKEKKLIAYKPKPHQSKALKEAKNYFVKENNSRGKLVFPCGAGKSLTGYWITKELKPKSIIVAVPSLSLVKQTLEVYLRETVANNDKIEWLCVCSDEGIGKNDDIIVHTNEIGVPCVTDKTFIANWLKKNSKKKTIVFTTYQSGKTIAEACAIAKHSFDLGILDEAHKTVGDKDKLFSYLLFDKNIKITKRIFMTATERRYAGSSDTILSMDDLAVYGETFATLSFKEAIELGILSDYKIITLFISDNDVKELIQKNAFVKPEGKDWDKETEARTLASLIALRKAMKDYPIHHAVTFHSSIKKADAFEQSQKTFTKAYPQYKNIDSYHVSGAMSTGERGKIVDEFAVSNKAVITNAKCLTEGVDVPNIDCVLFADPRKSTVDIVQAVGRALRKKDGKDFGYVILPVFTKSKNKEEIIESDEFKEILSTIRALASNDERIVEYFRDISKGKKHNKKDSLIQFNIDENIAELINENDLIEKLELTTWSKLAKLSWMPFDEAREFVRGLNLKNWKEWRKYSSTSNKPLDLPTAPPMVYSKQGWINWSDFLGHTRFQTNNHEYATFENAKLLVQTLKLNSYKDWAKYDVDWKNNNNIPRSADKVYKNQGWKNWGDFLGTNKIANYNIKIHSFEKAKQILKTLNIQTQNEYKSYIRSKQPIGLVLNANRTYKNKGWLSWGDYLGTGKKRKNESWMKFREAKVFVQKLNLKNSSEWHSYCKLDSKNKNIPSNPNKVYKSQWNGMGDFLGTDTVASFNKSFLPYNLAKQAISKYNIASGIAFKTFCKSGQKPVNIPNAPEHVYKKEWKGWGDFLGNQKIANRDKTFLMFEEARKKIHKLKLNSKSEYIRYLKDKLNLYPSNPDTYYKNKGWKGWADFLGKE